MTPSTAKTIAGMSSMCLATACWGVAGGLVSGIESNGFVAAAILELVTGFLLLAVGVVSGASLRGTIRALGWWLPVLGVLEAANAALYFVALQIAPLGLVMAVHLTSPVILSVVAVLRRQRQTGGRELAVFAMIGMAVVLLAFSKGVSSEGNIALGMFLSFASAGCLAAFITIVAKLTSGTSPIMGAGVQMIASGLLLSPALFFLPDGSTSLRLALIGVVLFAPAAWLYWRALRNISAIHAGTIQLLEPVFGSIGAAIVYGVRPGLIEGIAAACILCASWLETGARISTNLWARAKAFSKAT